MADFGEHWKRKPRPWIYVAVTFFFVIAGGAGVVSWLSARVAELVAK